MNKDTTTASCRNLKTPIHTMKHVLVSRNLPAAPVGILLCVLLGMRRRAWLLAFLWTAKQWWADAAQQAIIATTLSVLTQPEPLPLSTEWFAPFRARLAAWTAGFLPFGTDFTFLVPLLHPVVAAFVWQALAVLMYMWLMEAWSWKQALFLFVTASGLWMTEQAPLVVLRAGCIAIVTSCGYVVWLDHVMPIE